MDVWSKLDLATRWQRFGAFLVDWIIISITLTALRYLIGSQASPQEDLLYKGVGKAVALLLYFPIFTSAFQATPGKMLLRIKVVSNEGIKLSPGNVFLREILGRWASPLVLGHLWIFFNDHNKTAYDYLAKSYVVKDDPKKT